MLQTPPPARGGQSGTPCTPPSSVSTVWVVAAVIGGKPGGRGGQLEKGVGERVSVLRTT